MLSLLLLLLLLQFDETWTNTSWLHSAWFSGSMELLAFAGVLHLEGWPRDKPSTAITYAASGECFITKALPQIMHGRAFDPRDGIPKILQLQKLQRCIPEESNMRRGACLPFESCSCVKINDASRFPPPATSCGISYLWICSLDQNAAGYFKKTACARIHSSRMRSMVIESEWL